VGEELKGEISFSENLTHSVNQLCRLINGGVIQLYQQL
jgi:hypothetical protein